MTDVRINIYKNKEIETIIATQETVKQIIQKYTPIQIHLILSYIEIDFNQEIETAKVYGELKEITSFGGYIVGLLATEFQNIYQ